MEGGSGGGGDGDGGATTQTADGGSMDGGEQESRRAGEQERSRRGGADARCHAVCVCVCVCRVARGRGRNDTHTHMTHVAGWTHETEDARWGLRAQSRRAQVCGRASERRARQRVTTDPGVRGLGTRRRRAPPREAVGAGARLPLRGVECPSVPRVTRDDARSYLREAVLFGFVCESPRERDGRARGRAQLCSPWSSPLRI